ncbi:MAG TPA: IS4 family transposase, partial [Verrucomicrobiae bacterium]|nr:IS4 family transposase [Verrucomicrobiae bacterium]
GGFLARKGDGEPGSMTLWRGLEQLSQLTLGYQLAKLCG